MKMSLKKFAVGLVIVAVLGAVGAWLTKPVLAHRSDLINAEIEVTMKEFGFDLKIVKSDGAAELKDNVLNLKVGKIVRFKIKNGGTTRHDFHLGNTADTASELYKNNPFEPYDMLEFDVGSKTDLTLTIPDKAGDYEMGCFQAGHYAAGMKRPIKIVK
ncbi:hypothetical protein HY230_11580 [Candidatus Acetothermia bacterium]|nr:hypothetical protein [Candidatus Acetothermia bacterium]